MGKMFGTDGVRGVANGDLTPELAFQLGRAGAWVLTQGKSSRRERPLIVIGRDTRISGDMLEAAMVAGFTSVGIDVARLGIVPTPAVAYLTRHLEADAGVMISASHNPVPDNGIKFFTSDGFKLPDETEAEIEALVTATLRGSGDIPRPVGEGVGRAWEYTKATEDYVNMLIQTVNHRLDGMRIVVDCANGAAFEVAPEVLTRLGAEVVAINTGSSGKDINVNCGSTYPQVLQAAVKEYGADVGIAHDGDGDRVIAVDEQGQIVNGDGILAICAIELMSRGQLAKNTIAATVYSNLGLKKAIEKHGGKLVVTPNGDRYVLEAMLQQGLDLGGEQSGHIIFLRHNTTGDGVLTALQLLAAVKGRNQPLSQLAQVLTPFPQLLQNISVRDKRWEDREVICRTIEQAEAMLGTEGRIYVRASGTEPVIRVMGESSDEDLLREAVDMISRVIKAELGADR